MVSRIQFLAGQGRNPEKARSLVPGGLLGRALAIAAAGLFLVAGLFISAVVFSVMLVAGLIGGGWLWWKSRHLRRDLRERIAQMQATHAERRPPAGQAPGRSGDVLEGDFIQEADPPRESPGGAPRPQH